MALNSYPYGSAFKYKDETPGQALDLRTGSGKPAKDSFMCITAGSAYSDEERR